MRRTRRVMHAVFTGHVYFFSLWICEDGKSCVRTHSKEPLEMFQQNDLNKKKKCVCSAGERRPRVCQSPDQDVVLLLLPQHARTEALSQLLSQCDEGLSGEPG